ncbi:sulfatase-like hydrolase/transferase [Botryobacter ruber]|uniref:sulfatase-like hydrolase/transferase n=1 Tax=Botryobacter ruber TaxID=2171629 RepID=UPI000E0AEC43|nr:sulfatase-like hydrolase/transferase [Botryobacter ruber]
MACFLSVWAQQTKDRPNILWIVSEDNSPLLGCYGDKFATTPNLDKLAKEGVLYRNAFASGPACAISRTTLITGMYATSMGTEQMRSTYPIPTFIKFYPKYLQEAGYYTTNNGKEDYNIAKKPGLWDRKIWDESSNKATYKNRQPGQPFFAIFNLSVSHESSIHRQAATLKHDPEKVQLPPYHPATPEMKHDWALYYDKVQAMDQQVGKLLRELEEAGLAENTIVFYYSDHGGVLARSKRFMNDSGLRVPLLIRFPKKYAHLAPGKPGSETDRVVSFIDFAPTIFSLAGIRVPGHMQGKPFLGEQQAPEKEFAFSFRGRIDERDELIRSVRDKKYRYVRNFLPHKPYGLRNEYLWRAPSIGSWEKSYKAGTLNAIQAAFWQPKPTEELYDVTADPHNIHNLAGDKKYREVLEKMRKATHDMMLQSRDAGFIPEAMRVEISKTGTSYDYARSAAYPLEKILETAEMATTRDAGHLKQLTERLSDKSPIVRYWSANGCIILGRQAQAAKPELTKLLNDPEPSVRIAAAEALYGLGEKTDVLQVLTQSLTSENDFVRVHALTVLETMEKDAQPALPAIKQIAASSESKKKGSIAAHDVQVATHIITRFREGFAKR